jgi:outer membrane protein OmpA-like peptidoglycan-associated protein
MTYVRKLLLAGVALSLIAVPAAAGPGDRPILLAQAEGEATTPEATVINDPVLLAEQAVEDARAKLRAAMASGRGIAQARQELRDALRALEDVREAAGLPPEGKEGEEGVPAAEESTPVEEAPATETQTAPETTPPTPEESPPAADEQPLVIEQPPALVEEPPPPTAETPPAIEPPPVTEPTAPTELPATTEQPPAEVAPAVEPAPTEPAPTEQAAPPAAPLPPPVIDLPPPVVEEPPPPSPPAAAEGEFDLENFAERPNFGEEQPAAAPMPELPATAEVVREGAALPAPDGRVIVKNQGQVTVVHDDTGRFLQRGDEVRTEKTANETETTIVTRPDGTEIVTVRDRWGNIIQRYRKNRDGSVQILIGEMEQPGFVGRIFGQGARPAAPPPPQPPASLNLQFGPLTVQIPQQQYIVESSRADEQQLQQALMAPPVEQVERPYSLEEIRRSGRLRDKLRRIDLDTITFETNQATIPEDQIAQMQTVGVALRDIIQQDPTQVFLIEGHTDAVGSDLYNLALSDRRAETVAQVLSYYFGIPPENIVTQGYGEQYLKVPTVAPERQNRRVAFRNITYLLRAGG